MTENTSPSGDRADALTALLADAPKADDHDGVRSYLHGLAALGCAPILVYPASKKPADVRTPQKRRAEDKAARDAAQAAGHRAPHTVKSQAGVHLATADTAVLDAYLDRYVETFGGAVEVNVAVSLGRSRLVVVDCDTSAQLAAFLAETEADPDTAPTVRTPGMLGPDGVTFVHSDGGHFYFAVPDGVELPPGPPGAMKVGGDDGYSVMWGVGNYVLTPPSVRPEGVYAATGENVYELPGWLAETIAAHGRTYAEQARRSLDRADTAAEPVAQWGAAVPWAAILQPAGWTPVGKADGCGCPMWTAPGVHGNPKSATAHEPGCARWTDSPDPPLHVWTDNPGDPWAGRIAATGKPTFSKLQAVALLHYDGKEGAAMDALGIDLTDGDEMVPPGDELPADFGRTAPPNTAAVGDGTVGGDADDPRADEATMRKIRDRASQLWIDREARKLLAEHDATAVELPPFRTLDELLAAPDDPVRMRIDGVWPSGGAKVLCAAPAGAGKTTLSGNLIRSLADGDPFLGTFEVHRRAERIVVIDNEMTEGMLTRWMRRQGVVNTAAVVGLVCLRGKGGLFDLGNDRVRDMWSQRLADLGTDFVVFDCVKPALEAMGLDENREMGKLLYPLTDMLAAAGVADVLVHHHMGHANERARGDSSALGWSDANWKIVHEGGESPRYFATDKVRDADDLVPEGLLSWDRTTNRLRYVGGNRAATGSNETLESRINEVRAVLTDRHAEGRKDDEGLTKTELKLAVGGSKKITAEAIDRVHKRGLAVVTRGRGGAMLYRIAPKALDPMYVGEVEDDAPAAPDGGANTVAAPPRPAGNRPTGHKRRHPA